MLRVILILMLISVFGRTEAQKADLYTASNEPIKVVSVFPNPASETISVLFEQPLAASSVLIMYTIIGNEVTIEPELLNEYEMRVRVRDLPSGYYLLAVRNEKSGLKATRKFLKR